MTLLGSSIVVIGGQIERSSVGDVFAFDLNGPQETGVKWEDMAGFPSPRRNHTTVNYNQMLYV